MPKLKSPDIETLLQILVAEGEVHRAALKVLTTSRYDTHAFPALLGAELAAALAQVNPDNPREVLLHRRIVAARDRLLAPAATGRVCH